MTQRDGALAVLKVLREAGHSAYFAGGCVRDLLLGRAPKDWDVATSATPEQVQRLFRRTLAIGAAFGVIKVLWRPGQEYEVATYRTEGDYSDGRRPDQVHYSTSPKEDVERRDFTLNALLLDPFPAAGRAEEEGADRHPREDGVVLDFVRGVPDLRAGLIRAVGDPHERFREDRLRMLRAVRFASRFGFTIESATQLAIQAHAKELKVVSVERIVNELDGIWGSGRAALGHELLGATGLWEGLASQLQSRASDLDLSRRLLHLDLLPHLLRLAERAPSLLRDASGPLLHRIWSLSEHRYSATEELLNRLFAPDSLVDLPRPLPAEDRVILAWGLILEGEPKDLDRTMRSLKFSRERQRAVEGLVALAPRLRSLRARAESLPAGRRLVREGGALARAYQLTLLDDEGTVEAARAWSTIDAELQQDPLPSLPLVGGADLKAMGLTPGPEFKRYLGAIEEAVYARTVRTQSEALALLAQLVAADPK